MDQEAGVAIARLERRFEALSPARDPRPLEERLELAQRGLKREQNKLLAEGAQLRKEVQTVLTELDTAERDSTIKSADDVTQFVEAAVAFQQRLLSQAQYPETINQWGRWDINMHLRAKLYRTEIEDVLYRGKPIKRDLGVSDPNKESPDVAQHIADLQQRTTLLYSAAAEAVRRFGAEAIEGLKVSPREAIQPDQGTRRHTLAVETVKRVADAAKDLQSQIPRALLDAAAGAREKLGWEEILPENPDEDLYTGPPPEIDTLTRTDAPEEAEQKVAEQAAETIELSSLEDSLGGPSFTSAPSTDSVTSSKSSTSEAATATETAPAIASATVPATATSEPETEDHNDIHVGTTSVAQPVGTEEAALSASFASVASASAERERLELLQPTSTEPANAQADLPEQSQPTPAKSADFEETVSEPAPAKPIDELEAPKRTTKSSVPTKSDETVAPAESSTSSAAHLVHEDL